MPLVFRRFAALALLALLAAFVPYARPALAATFTVINTADSGAGSLRAAISSANAAPGSLISFNIPTSDPGHNAAGYWTIQPTSPLPALSGGSTTIDGTTQPGGRATGPKIVLNGANAGQSHGIQITSANNFVKGLVIDGFLGTPGIDYAAGSGVYIVGTGASGNQVLGCWIGLTADGASALKNSQYGVLLDNGAHNNTIGGLLAADRNVISGNGTSGYANVAIKQTQSINTNPIHDNVIEGNYIGTTPDGAAAIGGSGNPTYGVLLGNWAQNNTIGGTTAAARNVISGHNAAGFLTAVGINIAPQPSRPGSGNIVAGNYIGLNAAGTAAIPNGWGVQITGAINTTLGGATAASRNIISGNLSTGVIVQFTGTTNNTIANNWIGLNAAGTAALGNGDEGVLVQNSATGTTIGPGNVISANTREGVRLSTGGNTVKGNFLSTNSTGTASASNFANGQVSVRIDGGTNNLIGGTTAADRNVIALSNTLVGIQILGPSGTNATVDGNYIGINTSGGTPFSPTPPVGSSGLLINGGSTNNIVGGAAAGAGNVIGGIEAGIKLQDTGTAANTIKGNSIGVGAGGQVVGNKYGIWILNGPTGNTIGGTLAGESNLIANNTSQGISIDGSSSNNNTVAGNTVRDNAVNGIRVTSATGIKITQTATSGNVFGDGIALVSGNGGIAAPTNLQFSTPFGTPTLSGNACNNCVIEVFTSATRDDGEGPRYLATTTATGTAFSLPILGCDQFLTATARDPVTNNTSPFTKPMIDVGNGCVAPAAGIQFSPGVPVSSSGAPHLVAPGASVVYTHLLTNTGTLAGNFLITRTTSQGWASQPNPSSVTLNPGESRAIQVTVTVPPLTTPGTVDTTAVTASVSGKPPVTQNDYTGVAQTFGVNIEPNRSGTILPPGQIDYTHYITNTGNGPDTITFSQTHTNPNVTVSFPDGTSCTLAAGAGCTRRVRITAAANASGADTMIVKATSSGPGAASDQSTDTTTFTSAPIPQITPNAQTKNALPPATVIFTHTVKNIGGASGQFTMTLQNAAPAGWSFALTPATPFTLGIGASKVVTLTVGVPASADANTNVTAQLQVTASSGASVPANDTVHVLLKPAFSFSVATQPTVNNAQPGQTVIFTHTLTNQANGADTFNITVTPPGGWVADPIGPITLAKNASQQVIVRVHVPNGQAAATYPFTVTAQTTSTPDPGPQSRTDTVVVVGAAVPKLSPGQTKNAPTTLPTTLTFTHTLTNTGNQAGTFTLAAAAPSAPAGWSAAPSAPACLSNLQPSSTCQFTVQVTVPAGAYAGPNSVVVTASTTGPPASTSVTDIVNVPAIPGLLFAKDQTGFADPGALVTYTHTLTNSGNITDSYSITFQTDAGWSAIAVPQTVANVPRGGVRTVQVVVTTPSGVPAGSTGAVTATATSALAPGLKKSVVDRTTINAKAGATLTPLAQTLSANPTATLSDTVTFVHTLRNSGSIPISYTIQANTFPIGWATVVTPTVVGPLAPGAQTTISIKVTVPAGTPNGVSAVTTVHVRQLNGPSTDLATANDTTLVGPQFGALLTPSLNAQFALPGATVIYTHTLRNSGANADTFVLSTIAPNGWDTRVAPSSVDLARNGSTLITVTVRVPTSALSSTLDIATVRAQSVTDNTAFGSAQERTTVLQVAAVSLSPPLFRVPIPGQTITFQHALVNIGNGVDSFALTATISGTGVLNWPVTLTPLNVTLLPGGVYPVVQVRVQVPLDASPTAIGHITVKAISRSKPSVSDTLVDVIGSPGQITNQPNKIYLPVVAR